MLAVSQELEDCWKLLSFPKASKSINNKQSEWTSFDFSTKDILQIKMTIRLQPDYISLKIGYNYQFILKFNIIYLFICFVTYTLYLCLLSYHSQNFVYAS